MTSKEPRPILFISCLYTLHGQIDICGSREIIIKRLLAPELLKATKSVSVMFTLLYNRYDWYVRLDINLSLIFLDIRVYLSADFARFAILRWRIALLAINRRTLHLATSKGKNAEMDKGRGGEMQSRRECEMFNFTGVWRANSKGGLMGCRLDDVAWRVTKRTKVAYICDVGKILKFFYFLLLVCIRNRFIL